jgi:hypothetical protein
LALKKKEIMWDSQFFFVTADEVTTIDNGTWCSVTLYYVDQFSRESMMATVEHIEEGETINNLTKVIMKVVQKVTSMSRDDIARRMLAFGGGKNINA